MNADYRGKSSSISDIEPYIGRKLAEVERDLILGTLARCGGNRTWASDILGISVRTLRNKLQQYSGTNNVALSAHKPAEETDGGNTRPTHTSSTTLLS